jgi:hypothetical protein
MDKDLNYVPLLRDTYAAKIGLQPGQLDELGEDAPIVLTLRILLQQLIGWNWYILSKITCPPTALIRQKMSVWRHSHFDPWGSLFRDSEVTSIILSDLGCLITVGILYQIYQYTGSFALIFWGYIVPWSWVNHWIGTSTHHPSLSSASNSLPVMITYLHHTHPQVPKYTAEAWTFVRGATATIDHDFGIIGTHFFHNISSDHVTHHLFSKIPHYYAPIATAAIVPLLGKQYHGRDKLSYEALKTSFAKCQWVEEDSSKDLAFGLKADSEKDQALWYRSGPSPGVEFRQRRVEENLDRKKSDVGS